MPLEGSEQSSRPVAESLYPLIVKEVELVVLHVFTKDTVPRTLDRPERDLALWADEFLARFCAEAASIELRSGSVGGRVAEVCDERGVDLVVLSWSQDSSPGHAAVVRDVLGRSRTPVLLLPARADWPRTRGRGALNRWLIRLAKLSLPKSDGDPALGGADSPPGHLRRNDPDPCHGLPAGPEHVPVVRQLGRPRPDR